MNGRRRAFFSLSRTQLAARRRYLDATALALIGCVQERGEAFE
jgi:hypothetical protein